MLTPNREDILKTWQIFRLPGEALEVRIPKTRKFKTISGYFDDQNSFVDAVMGLASRENDGFIGHYFTINPVKRDLLARSNNRVKSFVEITTSDADVLALHWLPIDIDAKRPAGISSTDKEHEMAISKSIEIQRWLIDENRWPANAFVLADSGNGGHLCIRIELDLKDKHIVEKIIKKLDILFSNEIVHVDTSTFNPARIWKIYGTPCQKGDDISERPHRLAKILEAPENIEIVKRSLLDALAGIETPNEETAGWADQMDKDSTFDVIRYVESHGYKIVKTKKTGEYTTYVLDVCPFDPSHTDHSAYISIHTSGMRSFKCHHNGCQGKHWKDLRARWEPEHNQKQEHTHKERPFTPEGEPDFNYVTKDSPPFTTGLNQETGLVMKVITKKNEETQETFRVMQEISECALRIDTETTANNKTEYTLKGIGATDKREICFKFPAEDMSNPAKFKGAVINAFGAQNRLGKLTYQVVQDCSKNIRLKTRIEVPCWKDGLPMIPGMEYPGIEYRLPSQIPAKVYDGDITEAIIVLQKAMMINKFVPVLIATILGAPIFARWFKSERFGMGIWGLTNSLKTSTVCALMSVWGTGYMDGPTLKSGRAGTTAYAATVIFASAGWLPQILDNVKTVDPRDAVDYIGTINAVLEGSSKNQGTKDGGLKESMEYCCTPIVTGEVRPQETATTSRVPAIQWDGVNANILLEVQSSVAVMPVVGYHWLKHLSTIKTIDRASFDAYRSMKRDEFIQSGHTVAGRTATIYSMIKLAWAMLEVSPFGEVFRENEKRFMEALDDLAKSQGENTDEETESSRFIAGIKELMVGRPDLFQDNTCMNVGPKIIGKIMPDQMATKGLPEGVWLLPIETLSELGKIKAFTQTPTAKSMTEALDQAGLLIKQQGKKKYQVKINGIRQYGWYVKLTVPSEENDSSKKNEVPQGTDKR